MKSLRQLLVATDGMVSVEMALIASLVLSPMMLGLIDFSQIYLGQTKVEGAAQDAMGYIMRNGSSATNAGAQAAAQAANGNAITVSSSTVCYCVPTTTSVPTMPTSVSCSGSCPGGSVFQTFMNVVTTNNVALLFPISWINLTSPFTVKATSNVRIG